MRVIRAYAAQYPDPITVRAGDPVDVGVDDPEFPGWRWCTGPDGRTGWVPEQLVRQEGRRGFMLRDYTARELTVGPGAEVVAGETMAGWTWVTTTDGRSGWVPNTALSATP